MGLTKPRASQIYNLDYKQATRVVTVANVTLSGGAPSQVDGVNLSMNDRVLVTGQSTASQNGLYVVATLGSGSNGTWVRTNDGNETGEIEAGMIIMVTEGIIYADTQWKLITDNPIVIGTTSLIFTQNYSANSITGGTSNVTVYSNSNVTISSAGTANVLTISSTGIVVTGTANITGNIIPTANATYSLGSATNYFKSLYVAGNSIYLGNITLGTTSGILTVNSSNVVTADASGNISTAGNVTGGNLLSTGIISTSGNITGGNISAVNAAIDRGAAPDNWDTLINMGTYNVSLSSWSGVTGAPVDSTVYVGLLSVLTSGNATTQTFYPGTVTANNVKIQWDRTLYSGTWTSWYKIINDFQVVDAGSY